MTARSILRGERDRQARGRNISQFFIYLKLLQLSVETLQLGWKAAQVYRVVASHFQPQLTRAGSRCGQQTERARPAARPGPARQPRCPETRPAMDPDCRRELPGDPWVDC